MTENITVIVIIMTAERAFWTSSMCFLPSEGLPSMTAMHIFSSGRLLSVTAMCFLLSGGLRVFKKPRFIIANCELRVSQKR
jgi:hypothetical protein